MGFLNKYVFEDRVPWKLLSLVLVFSIILVACNLYLKSVGHDFVNPSVNGVESFLNVWSVVHLVFGVVVIFIVLTIEKMRNRVYVAAFFVLVLWELFEFQDNPGYFIRNIWNNLLDLVIGLIGVVIGVYFVQRAELS